MSLLGTQEAETVAAEWEELVGWEKKVGGDFMVYRLCFANFEPCGYVTSSGETFKI